jgi:NADH dehydrogenase FAD-containing subunit
MTVAPNRPQVVIVGAGVAGYQAARTLSRRVGDGAEIVLVNPTGVALHPELLPQVMMGALSPGRVSVPLAETLPGVRVVLGAGYAGTAAASAGQSLSQSIACRDPRLREQSIRWILADPAEWLLPDMRHRLSRTTARTLRSRGVEVRTQTSLGQVTSRGLRLTDGEFIPTRTIVWSFGVRPDPLVTNLGLATEQGRIRVDEHLAVPGRPEIYACGDVAAVPDLTRPGKITPMSGQHALRQGRLAGSNVAASIGYGSRRPYQHRVHDSTPLSLA